MTVSSTNTKRQFNGDGSTAAFAYNFKVFADADLQVIVRSATGTESVKSSGTHYNASGIGETSGGTVTFTSGNIPASGETITLRRAKTIAQELSLVANDPFPAANLNDQLDKMTHLILQNNEELDRALKLSRTNTMTSTEFVNSATDRANKVLSFDSSGELAVAQELGTFKGNWAASTAYVVRDIVKDTSTNNIFIAITAHSSSGSQPITTNTDSAKWSLIVDAATATTSATTATNKAADASKLAITAEDSQYTLSDGSTQGYSALHYSAKATASASAASTSATNAASSLATFQGQYYGALSSAPTSNLATGDLYFHTGQGIKVYNGSAFEDIKPTSDEQTAINRLGTTAAVADLAILGTDAVVADLAILATNDIVADLAKLATDDIVADLNKLATDGIVADLNLLADNSVIADMATLAGSGANPNITSVTASGAITAGSFVIGSADINENDLESIDGITAGTIAASKAAVVDANKDITGFRNITLTGELDAGSLDISGDIDVDGTANLDVVDIDGAVNMATTALVTGVLTTTAATVFNGGFAANEISTISDDTSFSAGLTVINTGDTHGSVIDFFNNSSSPADNDYIGGLKFKETNSAGGTHLYAKIFGIALDVTDGTEDGALTFETSAGGANTAEMMRINNSGVGIGTTSPTAILDVRRGDAAGVVAEFHNTSGFGIDIGTDSDSVAYVSSGYTQAFSFKTNAGSGQVERMRIDSSGRLLIGTTVAPQSGKFAVNSGISSSSAKVIEMQQATDSANKAAAAFGLVIQNGGQNTNAADLSFFTASGGSLGERMRISSEGYVTQNNLPFLLGRGNDNSTVRTISNNGFFFSTNEGSQGAMSITGSSTVTGGGSHGITYASATGRFTVPVAGKYYIEGRLRYAESTDQAVSVAINTNANNALTYYILQCTEATTLTINGVANLAANDFIQFANISGGNRGFYNADAHTSVSIFLIG